MISKYFNNMKIVAVVGMTGCGKTEVSRVFIDKGFEYVRFGQAVLDEVIRRGLEVNEKNERMVREEFRKKHGMDAMAKFLVPIFDNLIKQKNVVADGLYSWEEYTLLKERYKDELVVLAVYASPKTRYKRLSDRTLDLKNDKKAIYRPFTLEQARSRDYSEIENLNKGGPIAMADFTIINDCSKQELRKKVEDFIKKL